MRRYAKLSPRLYTGELGREMRGNLLALALAPYLVGNEHSNMIGLYRLPLAYVMADLGVDLQEAEEGMRFLAEQGFIQWDQAGERVWVIDHARHELGDRLKGSDKRVAKIESLLEAHRNSPLAKEFLDRYGAAFSLSWSPLEAPSKPLRSQQQEQEQEQEQEQQQEQERRSPAPAARWSPGHDYAGDYNAIAEGRDWPLVRDLTSKRLAKLKARESESSWDWPAIVRELDQVEQAWVDGFAGFGFDWLIANDTNGVKVAEGRYRRRETTTRPPAPPPEPAEPPEVHQEPEAASRWERVLQQLGDQMDPQEFDTWIAPACGYELEGLAPVTLWVAVPNEIFEDWLSGRYADQIADAAGVDAVEFVVARPIRHEERRELAAGRQG